MTDNEIIKALECCYAYDVMFCDKCPFQGDCAEINVATLAFSLINRQKAEIERLSYKVEHLEFRLDNARGEAIKEFADRLKEKFIPSLSFNEDLQKVVTVKDIDNLVKEMVGDDNENL